MKRIIALICIVIPLLGCDPSSIMDANIQNLTAQPLTVSFVSSLTENKTLSIDPGETVLFQDGFSTTGNFIQPSLTEYDSVYIESPSAQILKVYKPDSPGKNIYHIEEYWTFTEPDKRVYMYDYKINPGDLE